MTFHYLVETKHHTKKIVIPFLDFPALNRRQKDKNFIHAKASKAIVHNLYKSQ